MTDAGLPRIRVSLVRAWPDRSETLALGLAAGARVGAALDAARAAGWTISDVEAKAIAVFGRAASDATPLFDGDRIELLRPLQADPKQGRRARAAASRPR